MLLVMTTSIEPFTTDEERTRVLSDILRLGGAVPGRTIVAYVDRTGLAVRATRGFATPDATLDDELCFGDEAIHELSRALWEIATACAPAPSRERSRWGAITGDLITVVCRTGSAETTPAETQFHWGWRYSNHLTSAFNGEIYAVTPEGWASLYGQLSGTVPALPMRSGPGVLTMAVVDAEEMLAEVSSSLLGPRTGECLLCYVHRMLTDHGCDCRLRFATHYRDVRAPRATALERRLQRVGGFCDCEIFLNGYELLLPLAPGDLDEDDAEAEWARADPMPTCPGVRAGSTSPCPLWRR
jgi:hypothetical protein